MADSSFQEMLGGDSSFEDMLGGGDGASFEDMIGVKKVEAPPAPTTQAPVKKEPWTNRFLKSKGTTIQEMMLEAYRNPPKAEVTWTDEPLHEAAKKALVDIGKTQGENVLAAGELAMNLASSMMLYIPSKLYGTMALPYGREVADLAEEGMARLGYQPNTEAGKKSAELIGKGFELFLTPARDVGEYVSQLDPEAGYLVEFGAELAEFAMTGGIAKGVKAKFKPRIAEARRIIEEKNRLEKEAIDKEIKKTEDIASDPIRIAQQKILEAEKIQADLRRDEALKNFEKNLEPLAQEELMRKAEEVARAKTYPVQKTGLKKPKKPIELKEAEVTQPKLRYEGEQEGLGSLYTIMEGPEKGSTFSVDALKEKGIKAEERGKVEPTTDLDLQTGTPEPPELDFESHPFREKPEVASTQYGRTAATNVDELVSPIGEKDAWTTINKSLTEVNEWADGKGVDISKTRDLLSEMAARKDEMRGLVEDFETFSEVIDEAAIWARRAKREGDGGTKLYSIGGATAEGVKQLIKGADDFAKYLKEAKAYKQFKPKQAAKLLKEELKRSFIDRSGNIRTDLTNSLGEEGYKIIQKMYLSKGASSRSAAMLKQMQKEVYRGLSRQDKEILDGLILSDRMADIANYKPKFKFPKYISTNGKVPDKTIVWRETFKQRYKLSDEKAADLQRRAESYFEWMKKPLKDMLDAELISPDEYEALVSHNYRRIKLVDLVDRRYQAKVGARKRTVYDSGIESLAKGRVTDIYEPSSEVMALEVFNRAYGRIMNNEANRTLLDLAKKDPENPFVRVKEKQGPKIPSGWNRLFVYEGGQRKAIYLSPEMSKEWIINSPETSYRFSQFLRYASGSPVLRTFATGINWGFALANLPRDIMHTWFTARIFEDGKWKHVYSPHAPLAGLQMARDQLAVFGDAALRKGRYQDYINEGGGMEFMVHQGRILQRGRHLESPLDKVQNFLGYFGETSEVMTRLAIRERALRRGATPSEATFAARDYMDFGQGGGTAKAMDNAVPYLNASIQGTRGLIRSMKENPLVSTYKLAQFAALTSGIYIAMKSRAPETEKNLRGSLDMTNNLVIPLGDEFGFLDNEGQMRYPYIKIPLDPSQRFFKKFFEASTDKWLGNEVDVSGTVDALNELTPVSISGLPPTLSGALGYISNKDFWLNEDIWKQSEPFSYPGSKEEYTSRTPEAFIDVGQVTGLSPERLKYSVSELVTNGTIWSYLAGEGYEKLFGDLPKEKKEEHLAMVLNEMPVAKRFVGVTNPYTKHATKIDKAQEEAVLKQFVENRNFDILVEGYLYGKKGEVSMRDLQKEANQYKDPETYDRLMERLDFERGIKNLPEKSFWRRMKGLRTEAKAKVFVDRLRDSTAEERSQLWKEVGIVQSAGGVVSDEFFDEVNKQYIQ